MRGDTLDRQNQAGTLHRWWVALWADSDRPVRTGTHRAAPPPAPGYRRRHPLHLDSPLFRVLTFWSALTNLMVTPCSWLPFYG